MRSFTAIGDTTNLTARLQAQARPGHIVISRPVRKEIGDGAHVKPLGLLALKVVIQRMIDKVGGFVIEDCRSYLSRQTLTVHDVGLRPFSPYLIRMANLHAAARAYGGVVRHDFGALGAAHESWRLRPESRQCRRCRDRRCVHARDGGRHDCAVGAADQVSVVMRLNTIQLAIPDELRGRITAVNLVFINASNQIGGLESGIVAALTSATFAVVSGGFACLGVVAIVAWRVPELRNHQIPQRARAA